VTALEPLQSKVHCIEAESSEKSCLNKRGMGRRQRTAKFFRKGDGRDRRNGWHANIMGKSS